MSFLKHFALFEHIRVQNPSTFWTKWSVKKKKTLITCSLEYVLIANTGISFVSALKLPSVRDNRRRLRRDVMLRKPEKFIRPETSYYDWQPTRAPGRFCAIRPWILFGVGHYWIYRHMHSERCAQPETVMCVSRVTGKKRFADFE